MNTTLARPLRHALLALSFAAFAFQSCGKKDNNKPKEKTELLLGTWRYTAMTSEFTHHWELNHDGTDGFTYRKDCMGASTVTFNKGTSASTGQALLYYDCDKTNDSYDWIFQSDLLSFGGENYTILQLDETTLKMSFRDQNFGEPEMTITYTFARK